MEGNHTQPGTTLEVLIRNAVIEQQMVEPIRTANKRPSHDKMLIRMSPHQRHKNKDKRISASMKNNKEEDLKEVMMRFDSSGEEELQQVEERNKLPNHCVLNQKTIESGSLDIWKVGHWC
ncbi:hypothetical protein ACLOJK_004119 [Asimina triloba]